MFGDMDAAIAREKQLKRWHRQWKINLIEQDNPQGIDLAIGLGFDPKPPRGRRDGP
jgi:putative endonuclease